MGRKSGECCRAPGCKRKASVRGLCHRCYQLLWYHKGKGRITDEELVESKVLLPRFEAITSPARTLLVKALQLKNRKQNRCENKSA